MYKTRCSIKLACTTNTYRKNKLLKYVGWKIDKSEIHASALAMCNPDQSGMRRLQDSFTRLHQRKRIQRRQEVCLRYYINSPLQRDCWGTQLQTVVLFLCAIFSLMLCELYHSFISVDLCHSFPPIDSALLKQSVGDLLVSHVRRITPKKTRIPEIRPILYWCYSVIRTNCQLF